MALKISSGKHWSGGIAARPAAPPMVWCVRSWRFTASKPKRRFLDDSVCNGAPNGRRRPERQMRSVGDVVSFYRRQVVYDDVSPRALTPVL